MIEAVAKGALVAVSDKWHVVAKVTGDRIGLPRSWKLIDPEFYTVLLPPSAGLSFERRLEALLALPGAKGRNEYVLIPLEVDYLLCFRADLKLVKRHNGNSGFPDTYAARGRDWQKEGMLRKWLEAS
jgi:hypothetical protein